MARGTVRSDSGRMAYGSGKPVCGRKFCSKCGKWRHLCDFHVDERTRGRAIRFKHMCKTCFRLYEREKYADPTYRARKREYQRMYTEAQRRAKGIKPRVYRDGRTPGQFRHDVLPGKATELVPNEPLRRRYLELEAVDGLSRHQVAERLGWYRPDGKPDERRLARALGFKPDMTRDRRGQMKTYMTTSVHYETAEQIVKALKMDPHEAGI